VRVSRTVLRGAGGEIPRPTHLDGIPIPRLPVDVSYQPLGVVCFPSSLGKHIQSVLLHHGQELESHTARSLGSGLPLLHRGFACIQVAGKDRLADAMALAKLLDLLRSDGSGNGETGGIEAPHGRFIDCLSSIHA
jgi:hypothetical protein